MPSLLVVVAKIVQRISDVEGEPLAILGAQKVISETMDRFS